MVEELCDKGVIVVFEMTEATILRKIQTLLDIYWKKTLLYNGCLNHYKTKGLITIINHNKSFKI